MWRELPGFEPNIEVNFVHQIIRWGVVLEELRPAAGLVHRKRAP
jgi:hypothetical protein